MTTNTNKNAAAALEELFSSIFQQSSSIIEMKMNKLPDACPLDLLDEEGRQQLDDLVASYSHLGQYIDQHYAALLIALSAYEDIDIEKKIMQHIIDNMIEIED